MGKKYIIELEENEHLYKTEMLLGDPVICSVLPEPYTEPDLEQVRKDAYQRGWKEAEDHYEKGYNDGYDTGLSDAWEAAKKVVALSTVDRRKVFGTEYMYSILENNTATEAIEKIRQYEQEEEMDGLRQNIQTIVDKCGYTLDEIAAVLKEMRGE